MLPEIADLGVTILLEIAQGITESLPELVPTIVDITLQIVQTLLDNMPLLITCAADLIVGLATGLVQSIPVLVSHIPEIIGSMLIALGTGIVEFDGIGKELIAGLWQGIASMGEWLGEKISGFFSGILSGAKKLLGIESPSKVWAELIGAPMAAGVGAWL
jgi:phage-related protein